MNRYLNVSCITIFLFTNCHDPLDNMQDIVTAPVDSGDLSLHNMGHNP